MGKGIAVPLAIGIGIVIILIAISLLSFNPLARSNTAIIDVARSNATVQEIFQGREHVVTYYYDGISGIPDYECQIGRCIQVAFSPAAKPEELTVGVWVNKDTMKVADIRASEDYLIQKAIESSEGRLFLSKYHNADVYASLGHWHPEVTFTVSDSLYSLHMFVNMTYTGEVTGVSASCIGHYDTVERITSNVMTYIEEETCVPSD